MSNYHLWWNKVLAALDPERSDTAKGISKLTP